jgi:hypothetical protein
MSSEADAVPIFVNVTGIVGRKEPAASISMLL